MCYSEKEDGRRQHDSPNNPKTKKECMHGRRPDHAWWGDVVVLGSCWDPERFKQDADNLKYGARLKTLTTASRESHTALSVEKRLSGTTPLEFAAADRSRGYGQACVRHV